MLLLLHIRVVTPIFMEVISLLDQSNAIVRLHNNKVEFNKHLEMSTSKNELRSGIINQILGLVCDLLYLRLHNMYLKKVSSHTFNPHTAPMCSVHKAHHLHS